MRRRGDFGDDDEVSAASGDDSTAEEEAAALALLEAVPAGVALAPGLKAGLPSMHAVALEATILESSLDWANGESIDLEEVEWVYPGGRGGPAPRSNRALDPAFDADFTTIDEQESEEELEAALRLVLQEEEFEAQFGLLELEVAPPKRGYKTAASAPRRPGRAIDAAFDADFTTSGEEESEEELEAALRLVLQEEEFEAQFGLPVEPKPRRYRPTPRAELFSPPLTESGSESAPVGADLGMAFSPEAFFNLDALETEMAGLSQRAGLADGGATLNALLQLEEVSVARAADRPDTVGGAVGGGGAGWGPALDPELAALSEAVVKPRRPQALPRQGPSPRTRGGAAAPRRPGVSSFGGSSFATVPAALGPVAPLRDDNVDQHDVAARPVALPRNTAGGGKLGSPRGRDGLGNLAAPPAPLDTVGMRHGGSSFPSLAPPTPLPRQTASSFPTLLALVGGVGGAGLGAGGSLPIAVGSVPTTHAAAHAPRPAKEVEAALAALEAVGGRAAATVEAEVLLRSLPHGAAEWELGAGLDLLAGVEALGAAPRTPGGTVRSGAGLGAGLGEELEADLEALVRQLNTEGDASLGSGDMDMARDVPHRSTEALLLELLGSAGGGAPFASSYAGGHRSGALPRLALGRGGGSAPLPPYPTPIRGRRDVPSFGGGGADAAHSSMPGGGDVVHADMRSLPEPALHMDLGLDDLDGFGDLDLGSSDLDAPHLNFGAAGVDLGFNFDLSDYARHFGADFAVTGFGGALSLGTSFASAVSFGATDGAFDIGKDAQISHSPASHSTPFLRAANGLKRTRRLLFPSRTQD